ncbi:DNA starvation/stationary phase protection protein [Latilactobacillus curvatus]|uniref:ferritin-like domain-containing protein n=1 Tax=Latilactobacillus curvatus TaxID=28038 RepID=UPI000976F308|nr:ferritin-like domain-containing protein [Latilactobacillus curvatus]MCT1215522.1 DNA starvation/stationary phase protection protein [Latilactobacillus curvatus]MCT3525795.1 DNA starvation/stationary phase protection protein [Latilactobacillus curvatus]UTB71188.1 DNA starvation/stationary phase protection protein [Latilactobacillus curvatus]UTB73002.1 DNA starvation/stationary phase protection protein [Latilactobacillus curvatus]UTB73516.1 DNA starvation/stationary phase protection protein [
MLSNEEIETRYQAEVKQADVDHHTPTAGAMIGHVMANLTIQRRKLRQMKWYAKGINNQAFKAQLTTLLAENDMLLDKTAERLLDEGEVLPTTQAEYTEYGMLTEEPRIKYWEMPAMIAEMVADYNTANLFVSRAIKLAEKEERFALAADMVSLMGYNQHQIRELQSQLGKATREGLDEEDDD